MSPATSVKRHIILIGASGENLPNIPRPAPPHSSVAWQPALAAAPAAPLLWQRGCGPRSGSAPPLCAQPCALPLCTCCAAQTFQTSTWLLYIVSYREPLILAFSHPYFRKRCPTHTGFPSLAAWWSRLQKWQSAHKKHSPFPSFFLISRGVFRELYSFRAELQVGRKSPGSSWELRSSERRPRAPAPAHFHHKRRGPSGLSVPRRLIRPTVTFPARVQIGSEGLFRCHISLAWNDHPLILSGELGFPDPGCAIVCWSWKGAVGCRSGLLSPPQDASGWVSCMVFSPASSPPHAFAYS